MKNTNTGQQNIFV